MAKKPDFDRIEPSFESKGAMRVTKNDRAYVEQQEPQKQPKQNNKKMKNNSKKKPRKGLIGRLFYWGLFLGIWGSIFVAAIVGYYAINLPPIHNLTVPKRPPNVSILAYDGALLANRGETGGAEVPIETLPDYVPKAFVAIEDHRFYSHFGLDFIGLSRAIATNVIARGYAQGGSTLTQQLAKNLFLTQEKTVGRKIQEAILSIWLESKYTKDQILELYLNRVYFGAGAYGIEAASRRYFEKSARALTLSEAALLAGLVKAPSRLSPTRHPDLALERSKLVLNAMLEHNLIKRDEFTASNSHLARPYTQLENGSIQYVADWVMDILDDLIGAVEQDIRIYTTIDPSIQNAAEAGLVTMLNEKGKALHVSQGAVVITNNEGAVKALIGGKSYTENQFNRAVAAKRQPGSSFKPFVYLTALENGYTMDTIVEDKPISINGYKPENYSREYMGQVTLKEALAYSLNTVSAQLAYQLKPKNVIKTAQRLGIQSKLQPNISIALGTSEVTPLEMAGAFTSIMNGGIAVIPHVIDHIENDEGKSLYKRSKSSLGRVINPNEVSQLTQMLEEAVRIGTGKKAQLNRPSAGKTGTTQDFRDGWFAGFTAQYVGIVWVGNDDNSSMKKVTGGNLPSEIWANIMRDVHAQLPPLPLNSSLGNATPIQNPSTMPNPIETAPAPTVKKEKSLDAEILDRLFGR